MRLGKERNTVSPEQRDILRTNLADDGNEYNIVTIEYPSYVPRADDTDCLKIVTRMVESDQVYVDCYDFEGRTVDQSSYFARTT